MPWNCSRFGQLSVVLLAGISQSVGQSPTFEVAAVKVNQTTEYSQTPPGVRDGTFRAQNVPLKTLLSLAYGMETARITGPGFLNSDRFDVTAKIPAGVPENQWPQMLQVLLTDRFRMVIRHEPKELDVYEMVPAKGGIKLPLERGNTPRNMGGVYIGGEIATISQIGLAMGRWAGRPLVDKTGLEGSFYYVLNFDPRLTTGAEPPPATPGLTPATNMFTAMEEQLGIKLEARKTQLDTIMVERAERLPTEN